MVYRYIFATPRFDWSCMSLLASCLSLISNIRLSQLESAGVFQEYYLTFWLNEYTASEIGWISGVGISLSFFLGIIGGKLYDAGYGRLSLTTGSFLCSFRVVLKISSEIFWVFLSQAVGLVLGSSLLLVTCLTMIVHHFQARKAIPLGIIGTSTSLGGSVFPIMLNQTINFKLDYPWVIRIMAFTSTGCPILGNILITILPPPPKPPSTEKKPINFKLFLTWPFVLTMVGTGFIAELGLYFPLVLGQLFALQHDISKTFALYAISIMNFCEIFAKLSVNYLAERLVSLVVTVTGTVSFCLLVCVKIASFIVFASFMDSAYLLVSMILIC
ncbi:hypothetical protein M422DRAFT_47162 [Sphaerobolus stellatus SS14]|uniref:Major facilitator superfamily (MFS) profile domain-containing protein n=1 Tax=Sphaerobolus stellatus (strain SS14) TaxID=990650 RepID=A0A0C9W033_SPHS4|nr:hypothetical protein M422DRAFT_47162 [Sphaerobolus stellatus SS14]